MGLKEQIIFPEIAYDNIDVVRGMDVIVTTTAKQTKKRVRFWHCSVSHSPKRTIGRLKPGADS